MSYRDWGSGEDSPRERRPTAPWDEPGPPPVAGPTPRRDLEPSPERYRTPSRRRATERGQQEPVDTYLPRWAVESGVRRADGGGRHAAPDDDDEVEPPYPGGGRRADTGWHREGGGRDLRAGDAGRDGEHTAEWTLDTPQERGYVGSRRAEPTGDEPGAGATPGSQPRRAQPRRPQVTWAGPADGSYAGEESDRWDAGRPTRRSRRADSEAWTRPAVDPWERPRPAEPPALDPWDASGVQAWGRSVPGRWGQAEDRGRWDRTEHTGEWDRYDTGQWERPAGTGQWDRPAGTGQWDRYAEMERWDRTPAPAPAREGWASPEQAEEFWSGTQLADDDPRRVETSMSVPRAPVIEDDLLAPDPSGPIRPLVYTAACYLVPALLLFLGLLFLDGRGPAGCVTDITAGGCASPRAHAFATLVAGAPRFGLALLSSLVVAVALRRIATVWRSATVALAAAVIGGGLSTVLISTVTGQPIG